jgi:hypothetical protein
LVKQDQNTSQYLRIQPSEYVGFPYVDWWKERGKGRGKSIHPPTTAQGLLTGIPYAGW